MAGKNQIALGQITPASTVTAVSATFNRETTGQPFWVQAIQFQMLETNTDGVYICDRAAPTLTANVHVKLTSTRPVWSVGNPSASNSVNAAEYFILPVVSGEGVRITVLKSGQS